ncbi:NagC family transcriptional regulator [Bombiscardovia nodaiensis]|uniref:NagC family transcriptional regulator n=1 Tax=Bombiscardovia nodaiensis TaxID=2932181 RepID=A0ABN6SAC2_9BIFI|nr:NagC family transcriptional regulator [Bombiscardovia nodaiensis]
MRAKWFWQSGQSGKGVLMTDNVKTLSKAIPESVRRHNRSVLLQLLYPDRALTRADLARASGLTRVAVSDIVARLLEEGLLAQMGPSPASGPGKRGRLLKIDPMSRNIITMDLSAPYVFRGAVMNLLGQVLARDEIALGAFEHAPIGLVGQLYDSLAWRAQAPILGVGIASPGVVGASGVVDDALNLGWVKVDLKEYVGQHTAAPVLVENDANAEAIAEQQFGSGGEDLLLVHLAQGVGAGIVVGGQLVRGRNRASGEIGHIVVDSQGPLCRCGKRGCLETYLAVPRLIEQVEGQPSQARATLARAGHLLGRALSMPVGLLDLPQIAIMGPARVANQTFIGALAQTLNDSLATKFHAPVIVRRSVLGEDAALLGACAQVIEQQLYADSRA